LADDSVIRDAVLADAAELAMFAATVFRETYAATTRPADLDQHVARWLAPDAQARDIADPAIRTLLLTLAGSLAGYAQLRRAPGPACVSGADGLERPALEIMRFYIAPAWHGRGLAQRLMDACLEAGRATASVVWLGVYTRNPRAVRFYIKSGFRTVGTQTFVLGSDSQEDLVMRWEGDPAPASTSPGEARSADRRGGPR
jgi:diamine N-acetyltransferase